MAKKKPSRGPAKKADDRPRKKRSRGATKKKKARAATKKKKQARGAARKAGRSSARSRSRPGKRFRILSLDGGGVRGIVSARWLGELESRLPRGSSIRDHFDLIAGSSTGAILACAISHGFPAADLVPLYETFGEEVFPQGAARLWSRARRFWTQGPSAPRYDGAGLERALRRQFGATTFGELAKPTLITTYDTLAREPVVMKTLGSGNKGSKRFDEIPLWEVVKASCSAPSYLPAHVLRLDGVRRPLIDGGVVANNPTACAVAEAVRLNGERKARQRVALKDFIVASFGTGESTRPISIQDATEWGALEWALPVVDVLFDGAGDAVDYLVRYLLSEGRYFRLQTRLEAAFDDLDDASRTNLRALLRAAEDYLAGDGGQQLDTLVEAIA
jgi:predicted acylesterase/phospholipase RssA